MNGPACGFSVTRSASCAGPGGGVWKTSAALLKISVHSAGPGIAQRLYLPAGGRCPATSTSLVTVIVVASSAPRHHTLPQGTSAPNSLRARARRDGGRPSSPGPPQPPPSPRGVGSGGPGGPAPPGEPPATTRPA